LNFKLILIIFCLSSCGLRTKPTAPKGTDLPSLIDYYSKKKDSKKTKKPTDKKQKSK